MYTNSSDTFFFYVVEKNNPEVHRTSLTRLLLAYCAAEQLMALGTALQTPSSLVLCINPSGFEHVSVANEIVNFGTSVHLPVWNGTSVNWFQNRYDTRSIFYIRNPLFTRISGL